MGMRVFIIMVLLLLAIGNMPIKVSKVPGKLKNLNWENINSPNKKTKRLQQSSGILQMIIKCWQCIVFIKS